mmetsp:Transcript_517/g.1373  ORF Transcript_517/g.1373 Transcript_517/m.1373 type:complete len:223 (-) Transcript_517:270-938(-)
MLSAFVPPSGRDFKGWGVSDSKAKGRPSLPSLLPRSSPFLGRSPGGFGGRLALALCLLVGLVSLCPGQILRSRAECRHPIPRDPSAVTSSSATSSSPSPSAAEGRTVTLLTLLVPLGGTLSNEGLRRVAASHAAPAALVGELLVVLDVHRLGVVLAPDECTDGLEVGQAPEPACVALLVQGKSLGLVMVRHRSLDPALTHRTRRRCHRHSRPSCFCRGGILE